MESTQDLDAINPIVIYIQSIQCRGSIRIHTSPDEDEKENIFQTIFEGQNLAKVNICIIEAAKQSGDEVMDGKRLEKER